MWDIITWQGTTVLKCAFVSPVTSMLRAKMDELKKPENKPDPELLPGRTRYLLSRRVDDAL